MTTQTDITWSRCQSENAYKHQIEFLFFYFIFIFFILFFFFGEQNIVLF
jgi:hypothetical protein